MLQGPANLDDSQIAKLISAAAEKEGATLVVCAQDHLGKAVAGRVAVRLGAGLIAGVTGAEGGATPATSSVERPPPGSRAPPAPWW